MLIREYCDPGFPALKCGNKIVLVSLVERKRQAKPVVTLSLANEMA
jgi:hypothetical protein